MANLSKMKLNGTDYDIKDAGAARQSHTHSKSEITDFPTLGTAASKNVPTSGNASKSQVVMGNDSRLSDSRTPKSHTHTKSDITDFPTSMPASDVSAWAKASTKPTYTASEVGAIATTAKGAASGVAELDANGLVPSSQLPSYVDDVLEYSAKSSFPATGETGKIYVDTSNNKTYRWSGSAYVEISPSLALGETSSTAYRGDRGKTAYNHATDSSRLTTAQSSGLYKIATTAQGHIASVTAVEKADITDLGIPGSDTNTHRPIQVEGTQILGDNTTPLNLKAGSNVSVTNSSGTVTIDATDTTYSFDGTYDASTNKAATVSTVTNALDALDLAEVSVGSVKTINKISQTNGKVAVSTTSIRSASTSQTGIVQLNSTLASTSTTQAATASTVKSLNDTITTGTVNRASAIPMGKCDDTSTSTAFTATVEGITELKDGVCVWLTNGVVNSAAGFTININNLGAKPCYSNQSAASQISTVFKTASTVLLVYNSTRVEGGCWDYLLDNNTTYTNAALGQGYGTCTTAAATAEKVVTLSSYASTVNGIVSVKFTNSVPANATMNINSRGAKAIYHRGAAITAGIIEAGDTATFIYSTYYHLIAIDKGSATTSKEGIVKLSSATDSTSEALAATPKAVKSAYDLADTANTAASGKYSKPSGGIPKSDLTSAVQTSLGLADSALQSHQTIKQDGVTGATVNRFGTCSTAAAAAAKTVSITTGTFSLEAGARVTVKFTNANTASIPTLNVNSKGAKYIFHKGALITTGDNKALLAGVVDFIYDGTQWHLIGNYIDTNTTVDSSLSSTSMNPVQNKVIDTALGNKVSTSTTINGNALTGNITLDASDVGAIPTTGSWITGDIKRYTIANADLTLANNGISNDWYPTTSCYADKNKKTFGRSEGILLKNGKTGWRIYAQNYNTSGTLMGTKGIGMLMDKTGATEYTVDDPDNFLSAAGAVRSCQGHSAMTSGSLDNITQEGTIYCSSDVTGGPVSGVFMMVETIIFDTTTALQKAIPFTGTNTGVIYVREKLNSNWQGWYRMASPVYSKSPSGNVTSATLDLSDLPLGTYLMYVVNNESQTSRYGCSVYTLIKYDIGTLYVITPVYEQTNSKMLSYPSTSTSHTISVTFDKSGYKNIKLVRQY